MQMHPYGPERAGRWFRVATQTGENLKELHERWLFTSDYKESTKAGHVKAVQEVFDHLRNDDARPEDVTQKMAVAYIDNNLTQRGLAHATIRDRLLSLGGFWKWLGGRGAVSRGVNPWAGHRISKKQNASSRPTKRGYTEAELLRLLEGILCVYPMVNLGMKASRQAERLALMHFIAFEGVIGDKRREIAEEARKPRKRSLSDYTEVEVQAFAVETAQGLNREQHADIRAFTPREHLLNVHELLSELAGDVLSASGMEGLAGLLGVFLRSAGIPYSPSDANFKTLVFEFATALDTDFIKTSNRRLHGREAVAPPSAPEAVQPVPLGLILGDVIARHLKTLKQTDPGIGGNFNARSSRWTSQRFSTKTPTVSILPQP